MPDRYRFWGSRKPEKPETFFNVATPRSSADATVATIRMYGPIDSWGGIWGVSAAEVSEALDALPASVTEIQLRVNSPGGDGFEGLTILNMLRAHPAKVTAVVDGLAASAASFIASGCDETVMSPGTQMMIHDAWGFAMGNAADMAKAQAFLNSISDSIADLYAEAAGGYRAKWRALMTAETWFTAKEAVDSGLADSVNVVPDAGVTSTAGTTDEPIADPCDTEGEVENKFDLTVFKYAGRNQAPEPDLSAEALEGEPEPAAEPTTETTDGTESADPITDDAAAVLAAAESVLVSADEPELTAQALLSLQENAARLAFGG